MHFEEAKWGYSDRLTPGAKAVVGMLGWLVGIEVRIFA